MRDRVFSSRYQRSVFLRQHLGTQIHKTNTLIAHSRESDVSLGLSELHSEIKTKFPNIFILKKVAFSVGPAKPICLYSVETSWEIWCSTWKVLAICIMSVKVMLLLPEILLPFLCPSQRKHRHQLADQVRSLLQGRSYVGDSTLTST